MFETVKAMTVPFLVIALSCIAVELLLSMRKRLSLYKKKDSLCNLAIFVVARLSQPLFFGYMFASLKFLEGFHVADIPSSTATTVLAVVLTDLVYYFEHRISHKLHALWLFHEVHHSSRNFNLTTSFRLSWLGRLTGPIIFAPLILLGFKSDQVLIFFATNLFYQFFLHTRAVGKLGFLEGIINTPSAHSVHHARNELYIDKNFGGILMIWDRIFGTYQAETEAPQFGILGEFESDNPLTVQLHNFPGYAFLCNLTKVFARAMTKSAQNLLLVIAMVGIAFTCFAQSALADEPVKAPLEGHAEVFEGQSSSLKGFWKAYVPEYHRHPTLTIESEENAEFQGTYKGLIGKFPAHGSYDPKTGSVQVYVDFSRSKLFRALISKTAIATMNGTLRDNDTIVGTATVAEFGDRPVHFVAHRANSN